MKCLFLPFSLILFFFFSTQNYAQTLLSVEGCTDKKETIEQNHCLLLKIEEAHLNYLNAHLEELNLKETTIFTVYTQFKITDDGKIEFSSISSSKRSIEKVTKDFLKSIEIQEKSTGLISSEVYTFKSFLLENGVLESDPITLKLRKELGNTFNLTELGVLPRFKGCRGKDSNKLRKCLSKKITEIIAKNFNTSIGEKTNLSEGIHRIFVKFIISKRGLVENIQVQAPHPLLEEEAIRVMNLIPKIKPGELDGKPVSVFYNLPITFKIENDKKRG